MNQEHHHRLALPQGTRIQDFEFHRVLGQGGFGITYLGWNVALDIPVAIKEYLPADLATREHDLSVVPQSSQAASNFAWGLDRFLDEARILARFQHRNIVRVHHFFEAHSTAYIVMEYAEGETLSAFLTRKWRLREAELKATLYPILDGLEVVHHADFLHRDIKPGNIIIRDEDNSPVLLDFGAARQAIGARSRSVTSIITPGYAPIEQYSTQGDQGPWTDIYALGAVCYRALTGEAPADATERVIRDPVIRVSWEDAQSYVRWLSNKTGKSYRLLSESKWEYVARAGSVTAYSWGNDIGHNRANCDGCGSRWDDEKTAPVGAFSANAWGLYDVHGNVWEWLADCWNDSYTGAPADGSAWERGNCSRRVLRGGSWGYYPRGLRAADRSRYSTGGRYFISGAPLAIFPARACEPPARCG